MNEATLEALLDDIETAFDAHGITDLDECMDIAATLYLSLACRDVEDADVPKAMMLAVETLQRSVEDSITTHYHQTRQ